MINPELMCYEANLRYQELLDAAERARLGKQVKRKKAKPANEKPKRVWSLLPYKRRTISGGKTA